MIILNMLGCLVTLTMFNSGRAVNFGVDTTALESEVSGDGALFHIGSVFHSLEVSDYCWELLHIFSERYVSYVSCLVPSVRPVKICQNCYIQFSNLKEIYNNISSDLEVGPDNLSCHDSLIRSDRLMLLFQLYQDQQEIWTTSNCAYCLSEDSHSLSNVTLYYMTVLNQSLSCFEKHQKGNHSILCKECKTAYRGLNKLYGRMEKNHSLCLDIEYSMSMTRRLWSKTFGCSYPRAETVPVIAVSSFMLFLPVIFYLSSFLHSEQKKHKLIHPKRAILHSNLMSIQDRPS